jgi:hypothetical protein
MSHEPQARRHGMADKSKVIEHYPEIARRWAETRPVDPDTVRFNFCRKGGREVARIYAFMATWVASLLVKRRRAAGTPATRDAFWVLFQIQLCKITDAVA